MRSLSTIAVLLAATVACLPPEWCRAIPGAPFTCCHSCCEQRQQPEREAPQRCECCKQPRKLAEEIPASIDYAALPALIVIPKSSEAVWLPVVSDDRAPRDYQRTLCRWRC
jgi:hypothetical protein